MIEEIKQKLSGLSSDGEDRGVSPVIGVILMVAITVVLAAVIGMFVMGLGDDLGQNAPSAQVSADHDDNGTAGDGTDDDIIFTHNSGDSIDAANLYVVVDGDRVEVNSGVGDFGSGVQISAVDNTSDDADSPSAIDTSDTGNDTVSLVYDDGSTSVTLQTYEI